MAKESKKNQDKRKFEVLTYLELTFAALEECFGSISKGKYNEIIRKRIDDELRDFYKQFFTNKTPSNNLTNIGKYALVIIGRNFTEEKSAEGRIKYGLRYVLDNLDYIKTDEYDKLEKGASEKLSGFFKGLAGITAREADMIKF
jgi:hypothetical protein